MSGEEVNQNFLLSNGKRVLQRKKYIVSCIISILWLWHRYRFSTPSKERMTHLFAANSCGERRHTTLPADPISPALPGASARNPPQSCRQCSGLSSAFQPCSTVGTRWGTGPQPGAGRGGSPQEAAASTGGRDGGDKVSEQTQQRAMKQLLHFLKNSQGRCFSKQIGFLLDCLQS